MTINELKQKRAEVFDTMTKFAAEHEAEGILNEEDTKTYNEYERQIEDLTNSIKRVEREEEMSREFSATNAPILNNPQKGVVDEKAERNAKYKQAVIDWIKSHMTRVSDELNVGTDSEGGYLVPEEWEPKLQKKLEENNVMRQLCHRIKTEGTHNIPIKTSDPTAAWMDEGEALTFSDPAFGNITLDAYKLGAGCKITEELLADNAYNIEDEVITLLADAIAKKEEDAFLNGNGTKKPTGILDGTNGATQIETTSFKADDVIDLVYAVKKPYRKNGKFLCNDKTVALLRKMKDGNQQYLWQPSLVAGEPDRLLGYPVYTSPYFPELTDNKALIAFGDFNKAYWIGDRGQRSFQRLNEVFAVNGMIGLMTKQRVDGKVVDNEAVKILVKKAAQSQSQEPSNP